MFDLIKVSKIIICTLILLLSFQLNALELHTSDYDYIFAADNWPPYYSTKLPNGGFLTEIIKEAYLTQHKTAFVLFTSWNRAFSLSKRGKYHGYLGPYRVKERLPYFLFSSAICRSEIYLYSNKAFNYSIKHIKDAEDLRVGIVLGYFYSEAFHNAGNLSTIKSISDQVNIKLLINKRLDLIAIDSRVMKYFVDTLYPTFKKQYIQHLKITEDSVHLAISKAIPNTKQVYKEFEDGLKQLRKQGRINSIMKKHGIAL
ncbi:transporter substrate-binding domain-containing protein [Zooshikella marina]|uniref:substrate-binding periplasmic protein n=1 Tax=Zooshikella ganghwensis TaxID=202772 RepID=UPI001BAE76B7|nr:transporter substrate-binding domain-containing protein [Zooshikella ganghwensis]MBU2707276.1 transporter substrate-binding domain-containing protein [Zooshikella ganghwensis]